MDRFTSISFKNFVSTIEGEFQVRLGHLLAKEKDKAEMQMQSPTTTVLNIVDEETDGYGIRNWNSNKNIMYIICQYVKAEPSDGICLNPIKPFGHCFPICGATIDFATNEVQIDDIMEILQKVQDESKTREKVVIILERVNDDDHSHDFQISLLPKDPSTFFDEKLYITLSYLIKEKLLRSAANTYSFFGFKIEHARTDYAYSISSKVIGSFIFFGTLLAILLYYHIKNGTFKRLNHSLYIPLPPVAFHRQNDTEVVELMNNVKNQESQKSHEEPVNELVNPNFEEVEEPSKESDQSERSLSKMESPLENSDEKFADIPMTLLDL
ncbi:unnamed protein product, partial [Mesorhabditis belari]|uniref:Protein amnionless n=1 Tax=Mesorhabditis belari TaxID=2138241 RepID=A0AAF3F7K5_9BILA